MAGTHPPIRGQDLSSLRTAGSCALGVWIRTIGLKKYADQEEIRQLDVAHQAFHHKAEQSMKALHHKKERVADRSYEEMLQYSLRVVYLLTVIENQLQNSGSVSPPLNVMG